jgi:hypothetical protein
LPDQAPLPELPLAAWEPTKWTLHLWAQIVGKVMLATAAPRNHWWHAALRPDVRGLTTGRLDRDGRTFAIDFDFVDHALQVRTAERTEGFPLEDGLSVAGFDERLHGLLARLDLDVEIVESPFGVSVTTPFPEDAEHSSYDREYVERFWRVLGWSTRRLDLFAGGFQGKQSPAHLFWHSFDLAQTRFSGRLCFPAPEGDPVTREAYSDELISFGFWAGDERMRSPAYYSYTHPGPAGLDESPLASGASWTAGPTGLLAVLPYELVRTAADPARALDEFLQSAYDAGATLAGWNRAELDS